MPVQGRNETTMRPNREEALFALALEKRANYRAEFLTLSVATMLHLKQKRRTDFSVRLSSFRFESAQ
jgi:hypothetical protein